jgi:hypothetical protein
MGFHGRTAANKPKITMRNASVGWSGVKLATIGLWSSGNIFSAVMVWGCFAASGPGRFALIEGTMNSFGSVSENSTGKCKVLRL